MQKQSIGRLRPESFGRVLSLTTPILLVLVLFSSLFHQTVPVRALAAGCASGSPTGGGYTATVCLTSPAGGSTLSGNVTVTATVSVTGTNPGVQRVVYYLDGAYLLTDYESPFTFALPTTKWVDGNHTLAEESLMRDGYTTPRGSISVIFHNHITTPPVNNNQFQPSTGRPAVNGQPFILAAAGDGASGQSTSTNVVNLITSINPNLFLYLGDVYEKGSMAEFYNWYGTSSANFGLLRAITDPTVGNHEYSTGTASGYFDYWDNIPNYYSFNAAGWHFISLNSNSANIGVGPTSAQYQWLQQDLAANPQVCTIVYYHHPLFNIGAEAPKTVMANIWSLMAQYGVDIVLNGHDHDYQRWMPLDGNGQPSPTGITEFVAGGGGHGLQNFVTTDSRVAHSNDLNPTAFGVLVLQLNQTSANFTYRSSGGSILDSGTVPCVSVGNGSTPTPTATATVTATPSATVAPTFTRTATATPTATFTSTFTPTPVNSPTPTFTLPATFTPTDTPPATNTPTVTNTPLATNTPTITNTPLATNTPTFTPTVTNTPLATNTPTNTPTPTATSSGGSSSTFTSAADAYVDSSNPTANFGTVTTIRVDGSPIVNTYLRFNVIGVSGTITRVRLLLFANSSGTQGVRAFPVADNSWVENTVNSNTAPAMGSQLAASSAFTTGTWVTLDVTGYVTGNGTFSFGLTDPNATAISLAARESGANAPQLIIDSQ